MRFFLLVLFGFGCLNCGSDFQPTILRIDPLNGSTRAETTVKPTVEVAKGAAFDLIESERRVVLYDITGGAHQTIAAQILVEGKKITYEPNQDLLPNRDYELEIQQEAIVGDKLSDVDGSEWPDEPFLWPFRLRFSTRSTPCVRAAYLDKAKQGDRIFIYFSQPMDPATTEGSFSLRTNTGGAVPMNKPLWVDTLTARLDLSNPLENNSIYMLQISHQATGLDKTAMAGDDQIEFTGSQRIIRSRLPAD
ncbi:MAG: Ig-like domain-containing protein [Pseudomonadota bacterium]